MPCGTSPRRWRRSERCSAAGLARSQTVSLGLVTDLLEQLRSALGDAYAIERELGGGGMSRVFVAQERALGRKVVVKVLPPELAAGVSIERFRREIQLAASLQHPHIVPLLAAGQANNLLFYTMPLIEGESLRAKLAREGGLPIPEAMRILREVVDALAYAHGHGVVHRDIKPDNVMISTHHAVVTDFGVAKAISEATGEASITSVGVALGTPAYMAPEQASADPHVDHRADIYSTGALAYEMLTGRPPFTGPTAAQVLAAQVTRAPEPLAQHRSTVPTVVAEVVMRCLEKHPADRWQTAEELLHQLEALATPSGGTMPVTAVVTARLPRRLRTPLLVGTAVVALVAGYYVFSRVRGSSHAAPGSDRKMVAVLPFENLGAGEDEYFADGITEEITARLAGLHGLGVISRTSTMQYKKTTKTMRQIGQELGVGYVLEGSIRWERAPGHGNRVRVTPQLIRVADDTHLWASVYDTTLADIFAVQSSIAERVSDALDVALAEPERQALGAQPTKNLDAYSYYLRGLDYYNRSYDEQDLRNAVAMFDEAIRRDPSFALAYARLAQAHDGLYWFVSSTDERLALEKRAVDRSLELDPALLEGHVALGYYYYHGHKDYDHALEQFAIAQQGQPSNSEVWAAVGYVQRRQGKLDEALTSFHKAFDLDPRSNQNASSLGETNMALGRFDEAEQYFKQATFLAPDWGLLYGYRAWLALVGRGDVDRMDRVLAEGVGHASIADMVRQVTWRGPLARLMDEQYQDQILHLPLEAFGTDSGGYYSWKAEVHAVRRQAQQARVYYDSARVVLEPLARKQPNAWIPHADLAVAYAGLGRKDDAIREGREAAAVLPISLDHYSGPNVVSRLAEIYAVVGEYDAAIDQLATVVSVPGDVTVTVALLRIDPVWAPLRGNPRFEALLNRKEP
jgi:TolB-like protein/Flp pilus assembly protein TadD/tRNA A-37 threonylcarbamoyl transferase component Bud32